MAKIEKISDLLEIAVRIERNGLDFYKALAGSAQHPAARDVFSFLAAEEEKHIGVFRKMLEKAADYAPRFSYPGEYELYLEGVASRSVFTREKMQDKGIASCQNIGQSIEVAMEFEAESILFYNELLGSFKDPAKKYLDEVIKEEKGHFAQLAQVRGKLKF
jgi:rubrerythrin